MNGTIIIAFFIGFFHTTNYWDYPIYYVVSGAVILFTNFIVYNFKRKAIWITALQGLFIMILSEIVCLPFTINFDQISTTPVLCVTHTPLNQLIILWGLPIFMVISFLFFIISDSYKKRKIKGEHKEDSFVKNLFKCLTSSDLFIITIGLCAIGLVLIPEIIYMQDIYGVDYKRANTMFKLTYQAFIMFGICMGYIFLRLLCFGTTWRQKKYAVIGLILFSLSLCYIQNAVSSWYGDITKTSVYRGLDVTKFMKTTMPDDELAIDWLNEHITGSPVVLEAPDQSYSDYERVSVMTGLPTVLGWHDHEWLWKSDLSLIQKREVDIEQIYTGQDISKVTQLIKKYNVSYIYVGKLEKEKYPSINNTLLKNLGKVVFMSPTNTGKDYETYIVKLDLN